MKRLVLNPLVISLLWLSPNNNVGSPMRCFIEPKSVSKALKKSTAVFSGKVVQVRSGPYFLEARFRVERYWKGIETDEVSVSTDGSTESPHYRLGEKYLVFAGTNNKKLFTGICSRSKKLEYAESDLKQLGEGKLPRNSEKKN